jgi:DNA-directed RNA polymerase subunit H
VSTKGKKSDKIQKSKKPEESKEADESEEIEEMEEETEQEEQKPEKTKKPSKPQKLDKNEKGTTVEERKAEVLIKLRKYKLLEKERYEGAIAYTIDIPEDKQKAIVWCILNEATVGIAAMNTLYKVMKEKDIDRAIVSTEGRYTHAVKTGAKKKNIELLPKSFPVFDIFEHALVPRHEILTEKEQNQLLAQYKVQPYQMPQIKSTDPAVKAIGAKPGNILRIIRKSSTAGEHIAYRYVVE